MTRQALILCAAILSLSTVAGCTVGGELSDEEKGKTFVCKDFRDGETFSFEASAIENIRIGYGAPSSFDITTNDGVEMTLTSDHVQWLKCWEQNDG